MEITAGGSYSMWNFLERIRKCVCDQQKSHIVKGTPFLALVFSRGVTQFYGITLAMTFDFSRISKTSLEISRGVFTKALPQPPCLFFSGTDHR